MEATLICERSSLAPLMRIFGCCSRLMPVHGSLSECIPQVQCIQGPILIIIADILAQFITGVIHHVRKKSTTVVIG